VQGSALSLGNPTLWTITGWGLNYTKWRKQLVCDNYSQTESCPLQHFLCLSFSPFSFSFRILSLGGTVILHLPVLIRSTVTGWTALTSVRGLKHTSSVESGSYLAASLHTTHTHTHALTGIRNNPGSGSFNEKEKTRERANKLKITSSMVPLWKAWR